MGLATLKYQLLDYSSWLSHGVRPQPLEIDASAYVSTMGHQVSWYSLYNEKIKHQKYSNINQKLQTVPITYYTHHGFLGRLSHVQYQRPYMAP